jgi:hypothetical protein
VALSLADVKQQVEETESDPAFRAAGTVFLDSSLKPIRSFPREIIPPLAARRCRVQRPPEYLTTGVSDF